MIADLHAHYPMHLVPDAQGGTLDVLVTRAGRARVRDRLRALLVGVASRVSNYRSFSSGPRVTMPQLQDGDVRVVFSVLYSFFDELDVAAPYGARPEAGYLPRLLRQLDAVEEDLRDNHARAAAVVRTPEELDRALADGRIAFVHCVEGGFHLGPTPESVDHAVAQLARRGVAYVTLAHLMWRGVATNAPALPFLSDRMYRLLFPQPRVGLSDLGRAAVRAMAREGMLVDISHMTPRALDDTFRLLDDIGSDAPVVASHSAFRFGGQQYGLDERDVRRVAERDGVIGLIFAQHQLNDGVRRGRTATLDESFEVIRRHVDRIAEVTGSHRHTGIGSDLDGFIKPTLGGLESMRDLRALEERLATHYGAADAEAICSGNVVRVLRAGWRRQSGDSTSTAAGPGPQAPARSR
jgi:microsomal dipeptidase-like Zn-dependent dipeptidase